MSVARLVLKFLLIILCCLIIICKSENTTANGEVEEYHELMIRLLQENPQPVETERKTFADLQTNVTNDFQNSSKTKQNNESTVQIIFKSEIPMVEIIGSIGLLLSLPFFVLTFIIYACVSELKNNRGSILMNHYIVCLFIAYAALSCLKMKLPNPSTYLCPITDTVCYFFFFASFFWSTIMSYDIWHTLKCLSPVRNRGFKQERKKFLIYSLLAWGSALIATSIRASVNIIKNKSIVVKPEYLEGPESQKCWFKDISTVIIYLYGPMALITVCNITFFISTIYMTNKIKKKIESHLQGKDSQRHDENTHWLHLCFKLSITMGIIWTLEILAEILYHVSRNDWIKLSADVIVSLHGVTIFVIFVCIGKPRKILFKKFGWQKRSLNNSQRSMNQTTVTAITISK